MVVLLLSFYSYGITFPLSNKGTRNDKGNLSRITDICLTDYGLVLLSMSFSGSFVLRTRLSPEVLKTFPPTTLRRTYLPPTLS